MKSVYLIPIIITAIILGSLTFVYSQMYDCLNPPLWMKVPHFGFERCFELFLTGNLPDWSQAKEEYAKQQAIRNKLIENFKNNPEVMAFFTNYPDAKVSVRDAHVSYFSGNEDGFFIRLNLFFDENHSLDYYDLHCYFQNVHQFEIAQEDIVSKLEKLECRKSGD